MRWWKRYSGSRLFETRNRQGRWEVTLYNLLPRVLRWFWWRQHISTINTNRDLSFTTIQKQTCRRKQLMDQADDNSLTALLTEKRTSKVPRDRKYMHRRRAEKRIQRTGWILSHVLRKTLCEHVNSLCPPDGSMSSLLQSTGSSPYVLVHIIGPLAATLRTWTKASYCRPIMICSLD